VQGRYTKNLRTPDESQEFGLASEEIVELGDITVARIMHKPGWRWSKFMRPIVGGEWCMARHVGVVLEGRFGYTFADGATLELATDDVFDIPPGHDGYTLGDDDCVVLEWVGVRATTGFSLSAGNRVLMTLLFTDVVDSTVQAARLGDLAWHDLLSQHYESLRAELERFRGREIATTGDGFLASFDSTPAALHCAHSVVVGAQALGVPIRAGVHVGEVQMVGADVRGIAVHEAARIMAAAGANEIMVSEMVQTLASTAGIAFEDRGLHTLKGISGARRLYAYVGTA
jgi:class 3 adenylate cyclase